MELWREKLSNDFEAINKRTANVVASLSDDVKKNLPKVECVQCNQKIYKGDILPFTCHHPHCYDCIADRLERQRGMFERQREVSKMTTSALNLNSGLLKASAAASAHEDQDNEEPQPAATASSSNTNSNDWLEKYPALNYLVLCSKCHKPAIVQQDEVFQVLLVQNNMTNQKRTVYNIEEKMTKKLNEEGNSMVETCYENERRYIGKFSSLNLVRFERERYSTVNGEKFNKKQMDECLDFDKAYEYVWMEGWKPDVAKQPCDTQGWQYSRTWATCNKGANNDVIPLGAPTWKTFVRTRKLMRTRVKLSALEGWTAPKRDRAESESKVAHDSFSSSNGHSGMFRSAGGSVRGNDSVASATPSSHHAFNQPPSQQVA